MMWSMNEDLDVDSFPVFFELVGHHLSHLDLPVVNRGANVQGAESFRFQGKIRRTWLVPLEVGNSRFRSCGKNLLSRLP